MHTKSLVRCVALLAVVALGVPAMAKPVSKYINIAGPVKLGSTTLNTGQYHLLIDGTKVTVQQNWKTVAEVEGRWEDRGDKAARSSVLLDAKGEVKEIRFAGDRRVLVLATP